jgi:hypothetical protein
MAMKRIWLGGGWRSVRAAFLLTAAVGLLGGCGTTRMTDTQRTATEQLLLSNAVDRAISQLDVRSLAGKKVFLDTQYLEGTVDKGYLISSLRQHLLANGCLLRDERKEATYVVEARSGSLGTNRHSLLVGIPQTTVPAVLPGQPTQIPEIPFAKKSDQEGVAKIALFAYNRATGRPVWQSGEVRALCTAKDLWFLGTGPFQNGTLRKETAFAGEPIAFPSFTPFGRRPVLAAASRNRIVPVTEAATWDEPPTPPEEQDQVLTVAGTTTESAKATPSSEAKSSTSSTATTNPGGQAETQPLRGIGDGFGFKPDN